MKSKTFFVLIMFLSLHVRAAEYKYKMNEKAYELRMEKNELKFDGNFPQAFKNIISLIQEKQREEYLKTPTGTIRNKFKLDKNNRLVRIDKKIYQGNFIEDTEVEIIYSKQKMPREIRVKTHQKISIVGAKKTERTFEEKMILVE